MIENVRVFDKVSCYAKDFTFRNGEIVHEEILTPEDMGKDDEEDTNVPNGDWDYDE